MSSGRVTLPSSISRIRLWPKAPTTMSSLPHCSAKTMIAFATGLPPLCPEWPSQGTAWCFRYSRARAGLGGRAVTSCVNGTDRQSNGAQHPGRSPCAGLRSKFELAPRIHPIRPDPLCAGSVTAASNAHYARAPRPWILMCHDRSEGERMEITHEFLSMMLAVRRLGVTVTLHTLKARARSGVREAW